MDANGKAPRMSGEISMVEDRKRTSDVIISIPGDEKDSTFRVSDSSKDQKPKLSADSPHRLSNDSTFSAEKSVSVSYPSPEIKRFSPGPNKPPRIPKSENLTRRKSFSRSVYSKPKSRFGEQSVNIDSKMFENGELVEDHVFSSRSSPSSKVDDNGVSAMEITNKMGPGSPPLVSSPGGFGRVDEDEEIYKKVSSRRKLKHRKVKVKVLIEWFLFLCILGCLIVSLTVDKFQGWRVGGLRIWRWCVLVLVTFSGLFVTKWLMHFVVLLIELNYLLKKKVLYFVYGLKKSVQVCIWFDLVLVTWVLLFQEGVRQSRLVNRILDFITWTIASLLISAFLWLLKTLLLKILASSFHVNTFFDRIQESVFHQYILLTLSGPPVMESPNVLGRTNSNISKLSYAVKKEKEGKEKREKAVIDINKLHRMKQDKVSAWTMKMLVDMISNSGLTTLSNSIDESLYDGGNEQTDKEITNEEEAIAAAYHIFRNVAQPGCNYIDELDLRRFMIKEEVEFVFPMIDVAETGQIDRRTLTDWVVKVYKGRKALAHALNDTKTAVKQLNKLVTGILIVIMIIVWLLLTGIATTKVLVVLSSQLVLAAFVFGNTCKTIFEAIIFVFIMHPFDVGDRCVIDGVQTPLEKIGAMKEKIKKYLEKNPQHWHPNHNMVVKEIENVNKIKMALYFNHTMNFQDYGEKSRRKTDLVLEMKKIFEELNIRYDLLPQEVRLVESQRATAESGK
ncbi:UNVERIFIED_CONTAM: Mechanosensitive ion channel protein 10 [Sesamum radiatum]|uniref:Mechanosensitive ion channel protein n=1 Tax=Sesamum radiatum TaxID=300843 RepID=A0AAW2L1J0_SESRA